MAENHVTFDGLTVGYGGRPLIKDIALEIRRGEIVTLIGPNGAGKSTILKNLIRQLLPISGRLLYLDKDLQQMQPKEIARVMAVVLTERIHDFDAGVETQLGERLIIGNLRQRVVEYLVETLCGHLLGYLPAQFLRVGFESVCQAGVEFFGELDVVVAVDA